MNMKSLSFRWISPCLSVQQAMFRINVQKIWIKPRYNRLQNFMRARIRLSNSQILWNFFDKTAKCSPFSCQMSCIWEKYFIDCETDLNTTITCRSKTEGPLSRLKFMSCPWPHISGSDTRCGWCHAISPVSPFEGNCNRRPFKRKSLKSETFTIKCLSRTIFISCILPPVKFEVDLSLRLSCYSVITDDLLDVNGSGWLHLEADYHTLSWTGLSRNQICVKSSCQKLFSGFRPLPFSLISKQANSQDEIDKSYPPWHIWPSLVLSIDPVSPVSGCLAPATRWWWVTLWCPRCRSWPTWPRSWCPALAPSAASRACRCWALLVTCPGTTHGTGSPALSTTTTSTPWCLWPHSTVSK